MAHDGLALVAHADWSVDPRKRWVTIAMPYPGGWRVDAPRPVGPVDRFLDLLCELANGGIVLGLDLPIGVPRAYAASRPEPDFLTFLQRAGPAFFEVCAELSELGLDRPFYPAYGRTGVRMALHARALGFAGPDDFLRVCDRATGHRPQAAPLFWTLGPKQVGKAALAGWRDILLPAMRRQDGRLRVWPFDGPLRDLLGPNAIVVAETYPAEALRQLCLVFAGSKRRTSDRAAIGDALLSVMARMAVSPSTDIIRDIQAGFGTDAAGEDRFDSVLGLLCILRVLSETSLAELPDDPWIRAWEGWILGQAKPLTPDTVPSHEP